MCEECYQHMFLRVPTKERCVRGCETSKIEKVDGVDTCAACVVKDCNYF